MRVDVRRCDRCGGFPPAKGPCPYCEQKRIDAARAAERIHPSALAIPNPSPPECVPHEPPRPHTWGGADLSALASAVADEIRGELQRIALPRLIERTSPASDLPDHHTAVSAPATSISAESTTDLCLRTILPAELCGLLLDGSPELELLDARVGTIQIYQLMGAGIPFGRALHLAAPFVPIHPSIGAVVRVRNRSTDESLVARVVALARAPADEWSALEPLRHRSRF